MFPLIQLPRKSEVFLALLLLLDIAVSINSTSEEVRSLQPFPVKIPLHRKFPLIQLPRKSEDLIAVYSAEDPNSFH